MAGKQQWYIVDGYPPPLSKNQANEYEGHECIMILNTNDEDAHVLIDVYFCDREPVLGIRHTVPARRISAFRSTDKSVFGDLNLSVNQQYSLRISSDVGIIVQYGRCDVSQDNLAFLATLGYAE